MLSIAEKLRKGEISLEDAINSGKIPDNILHNFSCDCAERALLRERNAGREPDPRSWKAIRIKRRWIKGEITDNIMYAANAKANMEVHYVAGAASGLNGCLSARTTARAAKFNMSDMVDWMAEQAWQEAHLVKLIEHFFEKRNLLFWQRETEDGLYTF